MKNKTQITAPTTGLKIVIKTINNNPIILPLSYHSREVDVKCVKIK